MIDIKKYKTEAIYNYYKHKYPNYLVLVKRRKNLISYKIDSRIISYIFKINFVYEISIDKKLLNELILLKEEYCFNIVVVGIKKVKEYYCKKSNNYSKLKNISKNYINEVKCFEY